MLFFEIRVLTNNKSKLMFRNAVRPLSERTRRLHEMLLITPWPLPVKHTCYTLNFINHVQVIINYVVGQANYFYKKRLVLLRNHTNLQELVQFLVVHRPHEVTHEHSPWMSQTTTYSNYRLTERDQKPPNGNNLLNLIRLRTSMTDICSAHEDFSQWRCCTRSSAVRVKCTNDATVNECFPEPVIDLLGFSDWRRIEAALGQFCNRLGSISIVKNANETESK